MVSWFSISGFALLAFGVIVMPVFAAMQLHYSTNVGFLISVGVMIAVTNAGVLFRSLGERRESRAI